MNNQSFDNWTSIYKINVASYYFTSVAFLPLLCAARDHGYPEAGNIIVRIINSTTSVRSDSFADINETRFQNVSSISGITKESQNGQFSYNASKAATISLTEQLAVDFKRPGLEVRVNTLAPGQVHISTSVSQELQC